MGQFSSRGVISENPSVRFMPDRHAVTDTVTNNMRCSENQTRDYSLPSRPETGNVASMPHLRQVTGSNPRVFTSASDNSLPLNLSLPDKASDTIPRDSSVHESLKSHEQHAESPWCSPADETAVTRKKKQKLIVRQKLYDIVPIGYGLWLLDDNSNF